MQFFTTVDIPESDIRIRHQEGVVLLGSCFADHIGMCLEQAKFRVLRNPFGTLYNPYSIAWHIERCLNGPEFTNQSEEIFQNKDGRWHSWMHHSTFSECEAAHIVSNMNKAKNLCAEALRNAGTLIVTFGTAIIYELNKTGQIVANCHQQSDSMFTRRRLSVEEITDRWSSVITLLKDVNPDLQILFTVSPIRHKRDGFHVNQLSKATLLLAIDQIVRQNAEQQENEDAPYHATYFPAYEIMMDELRDYRFYASDMIHPSETAVSHIWQRFTDTFMDEQTKDIISQCGKISRAVAHRPFNPEDQAYKVFLRQTLEQIKKLTKQHPYISMEKEIALCNTQLEK